MKEVLVVLKISEQQVNEILSGFTFNKSMKLYGKSATLIFNFYTQSSTYHPLADIIAVFKPEDL